MSKITINLNATGSFPIAFHVGSNHDGDDNHNTEKTLRKETIIGNLVVNPAPIKKKVRGIGRSYLSPKPCAYIFFGVDIQKKDIVEMMRNLFLII